MTRRAIFTGGALAAGGIAGAAIMLPAIGFALGPVFEEKDFPWQDVGPPANFTEDNYIPVTFSHGHRRRRGGQDDRLRAQGQPGHRHGDNPDEFVAISTRCAHLGCPVRWVSACAAVRLPLSRRRLRLPGPGRGRPAGAAARPLRDPGPERAGPDRPPLQRQLRPEALLRRATRASRSTACGSTCTRSVSRSPRCRLAHADGDPDPQAPAPRPPQAAAARATRARTARCALKDQAAEVGAGIVGWVDERTGASGFLRRVPVPQGPEGDQLVLHARLGDDVRLPVAGGHRRVPGDVLRPRPRPRLRQRPAHHQRRLPRQPGARHASLGRDGDDRPDLPAHGRACSSSAPTSTRAS